MSLRARPHFFARRQPRTRDDLLKERIAALQAQCDRHIYAYCHQSTKQVLYSPTSVFDSKNVLKQLPDAGANNNPPKLRRDHWRPLWTLSMPDNDAGRLQTRQAFDRLMQYRILHETSWTPPETFSRQRTEEEIKEIEERITERGGSKMESPYDAIKHQQHKIRAKMVMDQRANSIADLAATLIWQQSRSADVQPHDAEVFEMLALADSVEKRSLGPLKDLLANPRKGVPADKLRKEEIQLRRILFAATAVARIDPERRTRLRRKFDTERVQQDVMGRQERNRETVEWCLKKVNSQAIAYLEGQYPQFPVVKGEVQAPAGEPEEPHAVRRFRYLLEHALLPRLAQLDPRIAHLREFGQELTATLRYLSTCSPSVPSEAQAALDALIRAARGKRNEMAARAEPPAKALESLQRVLAVIVRSRDLSSDYDFFGAISGEQDSLVGEGLTPEDAEAAGFPHAEESGPATKGEAKAELTRWRERGFPINTYPLQEPSDSHSGESDVAESAAQSEGAGEIEQTASADSQAAASAEFEAAVAAEEKAEEEEAEDSYRSPKEIADEISSASWQQIYAHSRQRYESSLQSKAQEELPQQQAPETPGAYAALLPRLPAELATISPQMGAKGQLRHSGPARGRKIEDMPNAAGPIVSWSDILDAEYAAEWPENVTHEQAGRFARKALTSALSSSSSNEISLNDKKKQQERDVSAFGFDELRRSFALARREARLSGKNLKLKKKRPAKDAATLKSIHQLLRAEHRDVSAQALPPPQLSEPEGFAGGASSDGLAHQARVAASEMGTGEGPRAGV